METKDNAKKRGNPNFGKKKEEVDVKSALLSSDTETVENTIEENTSVVAEQPETISPKTKEQYEIEQLKKELQDLSQLVRDGAKFQTQNVVVKQEEKPFGTYDSSNVGNDDFMETPKKYIKFGKGYVLSVYIKNGRQVLAPFNKEIYFEKKFDDVIHQENNTKVIPFCMYQTNSKAEAKFIEECPLYNVLIFNDYKKATTINPEIHDKVEQAIHLIQGLRDNDVMAAATTYGIDLRQSKDRLKSQLIKIKMNELMSQEGTLNSFRMEERNKQMFSPPTE